MRDLNTDESEDIALERLIDDITHMTPVDRKAALLGMPKIEVQILSELALMYEAYEICGTAKDVLSET